MNNFRIGLIEFNGSMHYEDKWGTLEVQQKRDNIKMKYCEENEIPLLVIPFWERQNMNGILNDFISEVA